MWSIIEKLILIIFFGFILFMFYVLATEESKAIKECKQLGGVYRQPFHEKPFCAPSIKKGTSNERT